MEDTGTTTTMMAAGPAENTTSGGGSQQEEMTKDTLIFVKSKSLGEDSKGRTKLDLRFSEEATEQIKAELAKCSKVKFQIHYSEDNAFIFVKQVQERGATFTKSKTVTAASPGKGLNAATASRMAALKGK